MIDLVINEEPELEFFIQDVSKADDFAFRCISKGADVSKNETFTLVYSITNEFIVDKIEVQIQNISFNGVSVDILPKEFSGIVELTFNGDYGSWFKQELKKKKLVLCSEESIRTNRYITNLVAIEPVVNNTLAYRQANRLNLKMNDAVYVARALYSNVPLGTEFDLFWNSNNFSNPNKVNCKLQKIFSNKMTEVFELVVSVPFLVEIHKLHTEGANELFIGKEVFPYIS